MGNDVKTAKPERETFELDFGEPLSFELPALVVSVLAYPSASDVAKREDLYEVLCLWFIRMRASQDHDWARRQIAVTPALVTITDRAVSAALRTVERRLQDRLAAGRAANAFLKEAESGETPQLPPGVQRLSLNELAKLMAEDRDIEPENAEARIWRPSLPVIHLAAAWTLTLQEELRTTGRLPSLDDLYARADLLLTIVVRAQLNEPLLALSRLRIAPEQLIRFRIAGVKNLSGS
jgi:hypothetical protein